MGKLSSARQSVRRRAVTALLAQELVRDAATHMARAGIGVMPVKGALLQHWLYADPSERALTDVDLLVRPSHLPKAAEALERAGYRVVGRSLEVGAVHLKTPFELILDLHPRLFSQGRYRMSTYEVFADASLDEALFGTPVWVPSPVDAYAHLVGKFGSDHLNRRALDRLDEIARLGSRLGELSIDVAAHLVRRGMRRVARYVLPLVHEATGDEVSADVCQALPVDPVGEGIARVARPVLSQVSPYSKVGSVVAHTLNDTIGRGICSGLMAASRKATRPQEDSGP